MDQITADVRMAEWTALIQQCQERSEGQTAKQWLEENGASDEWLLMKPKETEQHDILELLHHRRKKSSTIFCSQYDDAGWYDQLGGNSSPLAGAILDRIKYDAYKINIVPVNPESYRSMREVYGLDPALSN